MFYHVELSRTIDLPPKYFGPKLIDTIKHTVISEAEATANAKTGHIIAVINVNQISKGRIRNDGSGLATFEVKYNCLVFRPFKGEVLDAVVTDVNKVGFFASAGPVQLFVSNHLIPDDYDFSTSDENAYVSRDAANRIRQGSEVRLRIIGMRTDSTELFCIATMKDDFLGPLDTVA